MNEERLLIIFILVFAGLLVHSCRMGLIDIKNWLELRPSKIKLTEKKAGFYTGVSGFVSY